MPNTQCNTDNTAALNKKNTKHNTVTVKKCPWDM